MDIAAEDTLPDDAWKDSFDKLLDQRPELNVIKRNVRASLNIDSSCENSNYSNTDLQLKNESVLNISESSRTNYIHMDVSSNMNIKSGYKLCSKSNIVSTPMKSADVTNPFKCTLSPIGPWDLRQFDRTVKEKKRTQDKYNASTVNKRVELDVEYVGNGKRNVVGKENNNEMYSLGISPLALVRNKWKSKQNQKQVCFEFTDAEDKQERSSDNVNQYVPKFDLQPGKWRKSLNYLRQKVNRINGNDSANLACFQKDSGSGFVERLKSSAVAVGNRKSVYVCQDLKPIQTGPRSTYSFGCNDFKRQILQRCEQRRIYAFDSAYNEDYLRNCCKIGEGAFGEVFVYSKHKELASDSRNTEETVLKIIPIEGIALINGEVQKTFEQILPEVIISMELSGLNDDDRKTNITSGFVNVQRVRCVKGKYPSYLQEMWEQYDLQKGSENDHPKCFTKNQIYIVLELAHGGQDLEAFQFQNADQSLSVLQQIILTLAVGEKEYQFEHRDLHWGNVLVRNTNQKFMSYKLDEDILTIPTKGIQITLIDYTLSRMTCNDYSFYNDLSKDEDLFNATGDYQFEIYRMMRKVLSNKWETFEPKTNIFWISYIISKLLNGVKYKNARSKTHLHCIDKLKQLESTILKYMSCEHAAQDIILY